MTDKPTSVVEWRCFHCDEVFTDRNAAQEHFGRSESSEVACRIKMGAECSMLEALRIAEETAADAWAKLHNESSDFALAYHAQRARHQTQLQSVEELGYERGLAAAPPTGATFEDGWAAATKVIEQIGADWKSDEQYLKAAACEYLAERLRALRPEAQAEHPGIREPSDDEYQQMANEICSYGGFEPTRERAVAVLKRLYLRNLCARATPQAEPGEGRDDIAHLDDDEDRHHEH